jgi:hypothetical protein
MFGHNFFWIYTLFHVKIEKGKKPRRKTEGIQKREKKGSKKEGGM